MIRTAIEPLGKEGSFQVRRFVFDESIWLGYFQSGLDLLIGVFGPLLPLGWRYSVQRNYFWFGDRRLLVWMGARYRGRNSCRRLAKSQSLTQLVQQRFLHCQCYPESLSLLDSGYVTIPVDGPAAGIGVATTVTVVGALP